MNEFVKHVWNFFFKGMGGGSFPFPLDRTLTIV